MTRGERLLWLKLRSEQLGFKFRCQHPLGPYIADFACLAPKLIIEIDGYQHANQKAYDAKRGEFFGFHGFDVMRFPANLPFSDLQSMVQAIYNRLNELGALAPIPTFPQRGKEPIPEAEQLLPLLGKAGVGAFPNQFPEFIFTKLPRKNAS